MKKIILVTLVIVSALGYYKKSTQVENGVIVDPAVSTGNYEPDTVINKIQYQCDGRQHCSQMGSYEEAKYFTDNCPGTKMDGDGDGIPCERQFNR